MEFPGSHNHNQNVLKSEPIYITSGFNDIINEDFESISTNIYNGNSVFLDSQIAMVPNKTAEVSGSNAYSHTNVALNGDCTINSNCVSINEFPCSSDMNTYTSSESNGAPQIDFLSASSDCMHSYSMENKSASESQRALEDNTTTICNTDVTLLPNQASHISGQSRNSSGVDFKHIFSEAIQKSIDFASSTSTCSDARDQYVEDNNNEDNDNEENNFECERSLMQYEKNPKDIALDVDNSAVAHDSIDLKTEQQSKSENPRRISQRKVAIRKHYIPDEDHYEKKKNINRKRSGKDDNYNKHEAAMKELCDATNKVCKTPTETSKEKKQLSGVDNEDDEVNETDSEAQDNEFPNSLDECNSNGLTKKVPVIVIPKTCRVLVAEEDQWLEPFAKYNCSVCPASFNDRKELNSHFSQIHKGMSGQEDDIMDRVKLKYACPLCGHLFVKKYGLKRHFFRSKQHKNMKFIPCPECNFKAKTVVSYLNHTDEHDAHSSRYLPWVKNTEGNFQLKCYKCLQVFESKMGLRIHVYNHKASSSFEQIMSSHGKELNFCTCFSADTQYIEDQQNTICSFHPQISVSSAKFDVIKAVKNRFSLEMRSVIFESLGIIATCAGRIDSVINELMSMPTEKKTENIYEKEEDANFKSYKKLFGSLNLINLVSEELAQMVSTLQGVLCAEDNAMGDKDVLAFLDGNLENRLTLANEIVCKSEEPLLIELGVSNSNEVTEQCQNTLDKIINVDNDTISYVEDCEEEEEKDERMQPFIKIHKIDVDPGLIKISKYEEMDENVDDSSVNLDEKSENNSTEDVDPLSVTGKKLPPRRGRGRPPKNRSKSTRANAKVKRKRKHIPLEYSDEGMFSHEPGSTPRRPVYGKKTCEVCGKSNMVHSKYLRHMLSHTKVPPLACDKCPKRFKYKHTLKRHYIVVHNIGGSLKCRFCDYATADLSSLRNHCLIHSDKIKPHICDKCPYRASTAREVLKHQYVHDPCDICGYVASDKQDNTLHRRSHVSFSCMQCPYSSTSNYQLKRHLLTHEKDTRDTFYCDLCDFTCFSKKRLNYHKLRHVNRTPLSCPDCDYTCSSHTSMIGHKLMHKGLKPFLCSTCGAAFRRNSTLKKHLMIHTDEMKYSCSFCGRKFRARSNMRAHEMIHRGERPVKCPHCDFACRWNKELKIHLKSKHKDIVTVS